MSYEKVRKLEPAEFKRLCGVTLGTFEQMVKLVTAEKVLAKKSGRPSKLSIEDQVLMTLEYWREYRTHFHIGVTWGLDETNVLRNIRKVENILIKSGIFNVGGKKKLKELDSSELVVVDVTEHEIERPQKKQKRYYSGKQKCHTLKSQILVNQKTKEIICIAVRKGKVHDFRIWKESQIDLTKETEILADQGYQGIKKIHTNSRTPIKKTQKKSLTKEQKQFNKKLAKERIVVEHVHRKLKIFRLLSSRYRNRRKRFGLRINLIAGIYNYDLYLSLQQASI